MLGVFFFPLNSERGKKKRRGTGCLHTSHSHHQPSTSSITSRWIVEKNPPSKASWPVVWHSYPLPTPPPPPSFMVGIGTRFPVLLHPVVHPLQSSRTPIPVGLEAGPLTWHSHLPHLLLLHLYLTPGSTASASTQWHFLWPFQFKPCF